jgi:hypothetical protein
MTPTARFLALGAPLLGAVFAAEFVACSAAPSFTIGPAATDSGVPDGGSRTDGGPVGDGGPTDGGSPDSGLDSGIPDSGIPDSGIPDSGIPDSGPADAGTRVDPPTPGRDLVLADSACILSYQGPLANGPLPAVTELLTDARCGGRSVRFFRPGTAASWRGFDLTHEQIFNNSPHFALKSFLPDADYAALPAVDLSLLASTATISPARATWSLYFVARAVNHGPAPNTEQPIFNILGNDVNGAPQDFAFSFFLAPNASSLALTTSTNNIRTSLAFGEPNVPVAIDDQPVLCGLRNTGAQIFFETRRKTAAGTVTTSVVLSGVNNDPKFTLPVMDANKVRLLGNVSGGINVQGWLGEFTLVGRALSAQEHTGMMVDLARVHGF